MTEQSEGTVLCVPDVSNCQTDLMAIACARADVLFMGERCHGESGQQANITRMEPTPSWA